MILLMLVKITRGYELNKNFSIMKNLTGLTLLHFLHVRDVAQIIKLKISGIHIIQKF